jgi:hypothetical protein
VYCAALFPVKECVAKRCCVERRYDKSIDQLGALMTAMVASGKVAVEGGAFKHCSTVVARAVT